MSADAKKFSPADLASIGMGAAAVAVSTLFLKFPTPATSGYLNLGDVIVIFLGFHFGARNGALAGGIGSATADVIGGYAFFAPVTFLAKGLEGAIAGLIAHEHPQIGRRLVAALAAAATMILVYTCWHWAVVGLAPALASVPGNLFQGVAGAAGACLLGRAFADR